MKAVFVNVVRIGAPVGVSAALDVNLEIISDISSALTWLSMVASPESTRTGV